MLSRKEVEEIKARAGKATEGPWEAAKSVCNLCEKEGTSEWELYGPPEGYHAPFDKQEDAAFIAHSRTDVPALCESYLEAVRVARLECVYGNNKLFQSDGSDGCGCENCQEKRDFLRRFEEGR